MFYSNCSTKMHAKKFNITEQGNIKKTKFFVVVRIGSDPHIPLNPLTVIQP
jgi:hypothetical protein